MKVSDFIKIYAFEIAMGFIFFMMFMLAGKFLGYAKKERDIQKAMLRDCIAAGVNEHECKRMALDVWSR